MTEAEWNACTDPQPMLEFLRGKASDRKLRLFAVACCERVRHLLTDERSRAVVEASEKYAEGLLAERALMDAEREAAEVVDGVGERAYGEDGRLRLDDRESMATYYAALAADCTVPAYGFPDSVFSNTADAVAFSTGRFDTAEWENARRCEATVQSSLIRCIFGPLLFRPVTLNPAWLTSTVQSLAQTIYDERAFDRMPILADALEDAGCTDADILSHCRQSGEHCRGCWVVDLLLGKS